MTTRGAFAIRIAVL